MALPNLDTEEAAAAPVSASPNGNNDFVSYETSAAIFPEPWAALHNRELWLTGPDGTMGWRDQADGFFE